MKAVVVRDFNTFSVEEVDLAPPQANEVRVKIVAAGVCHSDLSIINGTIPAQFPILVGHEGAGIVEEIGDGVTNVKPGDHVILSFVPFCQECVFCKKGQPYLCLEANKVNLGRQLDGTSRVTQNGEELGCMNALGCMAEYAVVPSISLVPIDHDIDLKVGALVGCGVTTGVGAALNTADVQPGSTVAVLGCGGVGLSVVQGARIAGAKTIIAIDKSPEKLEMAKGFGATDGILADDDTVPNVKKLTDRLGVDYAFEVIGIPAVMELAYTITRNGGKTIMVGLGNPKERLSFNALTFSLKAKEVCGCMYGSSNPPVDFPRMLSFYKEGKLDLEGMITNTYTIDEAPAAFEALIKGENARGVITFE